MNFIQRKLYNLNYSFLMKDWILMESNPDFTDNAFAVYNELLRRKLNKRFKIIWLVRNEKSLKFETPENVVKIARFDDGFLNRMKMAYYCRLSRYIIDCNDAIEKINKNQKRLHLTHGATLKVPREYCGKCGEMDYVVSISGFFVDIFTELFGVKKNQIVNLGYPRNDAILNPNKKARKLLVGKQGKKAILWLPTFRKYGSDSKEKLKYGLPSIHNEKELKELDIFLRKNQSELIIKPHPAEDISQLKKANLANIRVLSNEEMARSNLGVYDLCSASDALITDYSSIYYDYLLAKKPIALAIEDIETYKKKNELLFVDFESNLGGEYIRSFSELKRFVENVIEGNDIRKRERDESLKKYHKYNDDKSSQRVVDFFLERIANGKKSD